MLWWAIARSWEVEVGRLADNTRAASNLWYYYALISQGSHNLCYKQSKIELAGTIRVLSSQQER
jgi:hypothetical protein